MEMTEKMMTAEHVLQDYLFDMSDWLNKKKTINQSNSLKNKAGMLAMIEADYQHYLVDGLDDLTQEFDNRKVEKTHGCHKSFTN